MAMMVVTMVRSSAVGLAQGQALSFERLAEFPGIEGNGSFHVRFIGHFVYCDDNGPI
jgi:hypothetical protein